MTKIISCDNKQEWDDYILDNDGHPLQLWGWGDVKSINGWKADRLFMVDDEEQVIGAAQVLIRRLPWPLRSLSYVPRGPIVDENNREELLSLLTNYVKNKYHSVVVLIEPDSIEYSVPTGWEKSKNHILPAKTIIIDLNKSEEDLMKVMDPNTRRYIRKADASELQIKQIHRVEDLDSCLAIYKATAKRAKFDLHSNKYYHDVFNKLGDNTVVFAAYFDGNPVAFLWLAISTDTSYELYAGMTDSGKDLHASYALKWHAIKKCKEWELSRYDFGGMVEGGVTAFKKSWTDAETELAGTFAYPLSNLYGVWNNTLPAAKKIVRRIKSPLKKR